MATKMNAAKTINNVMTWLVAIGAVFCVIFALTLLYWSTSRVPPFVLESYQSIPAKPGQITFVIGRVKRDIERGCGVVFSRSLVDANGVRYDLGDGPQIMNSAALRHLNAVSPDKLSFAVDIPKTAAPGTAHITTSLDYICNPIHQFFPISMSMNTDLEILPP
jgi:hypothetical protein